MSVRYTREQAAELQLMIDRNRVNRPAHVIKPAKTKTIRIPARNKNLDDMKLTLRLSGIEFETEYQFARPRKFRADIAILSTVKLLIEYEGTFSAKSRHTTVTGYANDCEKYNLCQKLGYKILRYTALHYQQMIDDVRELMK